MTSSIRLLVLGFSLLVAGCAPGLAPRDSAQAMPGSFAPLVRQVLPAVVNISVTEEEAGPTEEVPPALRGTPFERQYRRRFGSKPEMVMGAGSGFIIAPSGVIVTNNHVVGHATKITVALADGTNLPAHVIGTDQLTDIAVIKIDDPHKLPFVKFGDSKRVQVGDWILSAGNPYGLGGSVTAGIVSARGRDIGAGPFDDFLQLDAPINPGNSGGPVFDMRGDVVGVTTAIVSPSGGSVGIGFAIPSDIVAPIVAQLRAKGHIPRGWLGVSVQDIDTTGVLIAAVEPGGPAARAGLRAGDIVQMVGHTATNSATALVRAIAAISPGGTVELTVQHGNQMRHLAIIVGSRPTETQD